jgi:uncharacterized RDD family membrane protein YckC
MSTGSSMPPATALYCSNCGSAVTPNDAFCPKCAAPQRTSGYVAPIVVSRVQYAGFWIRFAAWLLDAIILSVAMTPIQMMVFGMMGVSMGLGGFQEHPEQMFAVMFPALFVIIILSLAGHWLYEALMTSSSKQATLGKMVCGLRVTDLQGRRLTFARATGRFFAKYISGMTLLIGYIIAGITERKQALHDLIAGTYVLKG